MVVCLVMGVVKGRGQGFGLILAKGRGQREWSLAVIKCMVVVKGVVTCLVKGCGQGCGHILVMGVVKGCG